MEFSISNRGKVISKIMIAFGVISMILGYMYLDHEQFWANLLVNGLFFTFISLGALFFIALQYATEAAWSVMVRRIYEAVTRFLPIGAAVLVVVFIAASLHQTHIYHWMDASTTHEFVIGSTIDSEHPQYEDDPTLEGAVANDHYDSIIAGKAAYLNLPFWWGRTIVYFAVFLFCMYYFR